MSHRHWTPNCFQSNSAVPLDPMIPSDPSELLASIDPGAPWDSVALLDPVGLSDSVAP